jgi:hypothetical protein
MDEETEKEIDRAIFNMEQRGITPDDPDDTVGLGDAVEATLKALGVTEERFRSWFDLQECNCEKRRQWLNNIFSWKYRKRS